MEPFVCSRRLKMAKYLRTHNMYITQGANIERQQHHRAPKPLPRHNGTQLDTYHKHLFKINYYLLAPKIIGQSHGSLEGHRDLTNKS